MPYRTLTIIALIATSIPALAYLFGGYVHLQTFPYGGDYHSSVASATNISSTLLLVGFFGLILGLLYPAISLWFGKRSRGRVLIVYGLILLLGVAVRYEGRLLGRLVFAEEEAAMRSAYRAIEPGLLLRDARHSVDGVDRNIRSSFVDLSRFNRTTGYPYDTDAMTNGIEFSYPTSFPKMQRQTRIVAHLSAPMTDPGAVIERITLVRGKHLEDVRPPLRPEEVRVYEGFFAFDAQVPTFTPCGESQSYPIEFLPDQRETLEAAHRSVVKDSQERSFAILTGSRESDPVAFAVQSVSLQSREGSFHGRCAQERIAKTR